MHLDLSAKSSSGSLFGEYSLAQSGTLTAPSTAPTSPWASSSDIGTDSYFPHQHQHVEIDPLSDAEDYVMVIGGLGYIGYELQRSYMDNKASTDRVSPTRSHTTLELLQDGNNVIVVDDLSNSFMTVLTRVQVLAQDYCQRNHKVTPTLKFHKTDFRSSAMKHVFHQYAAQGSTISAVVHFAAFKSVSESIREPLKYYQNNIAGLIDLMVTIQEEDIKNFVFSSSATVYGGKANAGKPLKEEDLVHFDENTKDENGNISVVQNGALGITNPYGRSKYMAEAILADVAKADPSMRITALRYFNPVGCHSSGQLREDPRQQATNLFPVIAESITGKRPRLDVYGSDWETRDGTAVRDFIHVVDLAQGHIAAVKAACSLNRDEAFRSYNLGSGSGMTVSEVIESFEKASGRKVPAKMAPRREGDVGSCVAATLRAEKELGWTTKKTVDDCTRDLSHALGLIQIRRASTVAIQKRRESCF